MTSGKAENDGDGVHDGDGQHDGKGRTDGKGSRDRKGRHDRRRDGKGRRDADGQPGSPAQQDGHGYQELSNDQLTTQVAELAGEITEAKTASRRQKLASRIPVLASRSRDRSWHGLQSGRRAAWKSLRTGGGAAAQRLRPAAGAASRGVRASGEWLAGQVLEMAPKMPIRSIATLRAQYPDRGTEELAAILIEGAARASAGLGAAIGVAAAVPFVPTAPLELGVETMALVAIELKLIAELHEVYGMPAPGSGPQRMIAYVGSWANQRGVRITSGGVALAMGSPLRRKLERRLLGKAGQSALALAPLLAGAAAGALINHRETRKLGLRVRDDLRKHGKESAAIAANP